MKRPILCVVLLISLASCTGASRLGRHNCSARGEVCIQLQADEPIRYGEPVIITITLNSQKAIPDLGVSIYHDIGIDIDGPQSWEQAAKDTLIWDSGAAWKTSTEVNDSITIIRKLYLPEKEGFYQITVEASTPTMHAADTLQIYMTQEGGKVYLSGTAISITSAPLRPADEVLQATLRAIPTKTRYPTLTPALPTTPPKEVSTPEGKAYPPPYP